MERTFSEILWLIRLVRAMYPMFHPHDQNPECSTTPTALSTSLQDRASHAHHSQQMTITDDGRLFY